MFQPLFSSPRPAEEAMAPGIPPWLRQPLIKWISERLLVPNGAGRRAHRVTLVERFDRVTRQTTPLAPYQSRGGVPAMLESRADEDVLDLVHFLLYSLWDEHQKASPSYWGEPLVQLDHMLTEAGSDWRVRVWEAGAGLERRVPEGVASAANDAMKTPGAGPRLAAASGHAFGRSPDASRAYADAIKAVEEAAIPVVQPKHQSATLGTVRGQMRGDGDWCLPIEQSNKGLVVDMSSQLWEGQTDRHGANNSHPPSQEAAESAVIMAVSLVQWLTSGMVGRRP